LHYLLVSEQESIRRFTTGTTHQTMYYPEAKALHVCVPSRGEQQRTAAVLRAMDDKIAVNQRIATMCLTLADTIYKSFVEGHPPGPETFDSVATVSGGGTPSTTEHSYWDGGIAWTTPSDVTAIRSPYLFGTSRTITELGLANCASPLYPAGSIFMTSRATIGAFAIPQIPAAVNQGFIVVVPLRREMRWWLFHEMRSRIDDMVALANGSTFLELNRRNFKAMSVRLGSIERVAEFDLHVGPLHQRAAASAAETTTLAELRDALLPKLMSGEIRVRDAEKIVGDVT
jgi:type I restriction enzyme S subunit